MSHLQPEENKSIGQQTRDTLTPGNASAPKHEGQGILDKAAGAMKGVKDYIVGAGDADESVSPTRHEWR